MQVFSFSKPVSKTTSNKSAPKVASKPWFRSSPPAPKGIDWTQAKQHAINGAASTGGSILVGAALSAALFGASELYNYVTKK